MYSHTLDVDEVMSLSKNFPPVSEFHKSLLDRSTPMLSEGLQFSALQIEEVENKTW